MNTKIAIQTNVSGSGFVTEDTKFHLNGLSYRYAPLKDALLFCSINDAVKWIERTSFYNGKKAISYSGSPMLVRVEVDTAPTYKVVGPVE